MKLIAALQRLCSTSRLTSHSFRREHTDQREAMSASEEQRAEWLGSHFWDRLDRLEGRHQRVQSEHAERVTPREADELRQAWRRYCEVIAELEQTPAELEAFRTFTG